MARKLSIALFATTALQFMAPGIAIAQAAPETAATDATDIVVTARREAENLQDVPVSVQVVTGASLQKLAITSADEISKLAPGLTLNNRGPSSVIVLRGVTWQPGSGTPATPIYLNEVPFNPQDTLQSLFDIGQIEVLRGPQGTSRGAPSISGAVTITTRKPDLNEFGGYVQGLYGEGNHTDLQGAINIPVIKDMLAVRLAANIEDSDGDRVRSVNSTIDPKLKDRSYRAMVLFQPTETLSIQGMFQRRVTNRRQYTQVVGTGSPGLASAGIPANFNGPALDLDDRRSVQDAPSFSTERSNLVTVNVGWEVLGHKLTYNYGRAFGRSRPAFATQDPLNILPGFEPYSVSGPAGRGKFETQEIRISSTPNPDRPFDYDLGWFSKHSRGQIFANNPVFFPGAFGAPGTLPGVVTTPDSRYVLQTRANFSLAQKFDSFYGNVRFHIDDKTELSGGLAIIRDRVPIVLSVATEAFRTVATPLFPPFFTNCSTVGLIPSVYPGFCDAQIPAGFGAPAPQNFNNKYSDALYNFSISHKFSDSVLLYATTGSSFRTGLPPIGNSGLPTSVSVPRPETAKSYEIGAKTSFGRRLTVNVAAFQLDYKDQLTTFEGVNYFNAITGREAFTSLAFYGNVDSRVRGAEIEIAAKPIDNLSLGVNLSYAKIKSKGGLVPCFGPTPTAMNPISFCSSPKGETLNTTAPFQATINGGYEMPITDDFGGYFRFNVNYSGRNPNYGNFKNPAAPNVYKSSESFAIVDLFAGVTGWNNAFDLGIYAKNVFDKQVELARVLTPNNLFSSYGAGGYDVVRSNTPREIGVTLRYAFGSR
ncbi:MAG TPA: TonB-dependent receptor [Sphingobium sp.]